MTKPGSRRVRVVAKALGTSTPKEREATARRPRSRWHRPPPDHVRGQGLRRWPVQAVKCSAMAVAENAARIRIKGECSEWQRRPPSLKAPRPARSARSVKQSFLGVVRILDLRRETAELIFVQAEVRRLGKRRERELRIRASKPDAVQTGICDLPGPPLQSCSPAPYSQSFPGLPALGGASRRCEP